MMRSNLFRRTLEGGVLYEEDQLRHIVRLTTPDGKELPESDLSRWYGRWLKTLQIELTDNCNERCIHCYIPESAKKKARNIPLEKVKDILRQFRDMNGLRIIFSGGETLLYPDLIPILCYARELDLMLFLHTNLLTITEEKAKELADLRMFNVQVSLYSDNAEEHDSITQRKGSFERTLNGLRLLRKYDVPVTISCPVMRQNAGAIERLKNLADELGVSCYFDEIMMAQYNGETKNLDGRIPKEEMTSLIERIIRLKPEYMKAIEESQNEEELSGKTWARRMSMCSIMSTTLCIDSDGTAYPCAGWNGMKIGNIYDASLQSIWTEGMNVKTLRQVKPKDFPKCKTCSLHNYCDMCAVYNYNENGDMTQPCKAFCEKARITRDIVKRLYIESHR